MHSFYPIPSISGTPAAPGLAGAVLPVDLDAELGIDGSTRSKASSATLRAPWDR
jgi:hypothetical protein